ncbi:MAG: hypothetical protein U0822_11930 [Anaerolineae bacterium]
MRILKEIGAGLVLVLAVVGFVACVAALVAIWGFREPMKASIAGSLTTNAVTLQTIEQGLREESAAMANVRESLSRIDAAAAQANPAGAATAQIARSVNDDLLPKVSSALDLAAGARDKLSALAPALDALKRIPFITVPSLTDEMDGLSQRITDAQQSVQNLRTALSQMAADPAITPRITAETARISTSVAAAQTSLDGDAESVAAVRANLLQTSAAITTLIDRLTLILTFLLPILAAGQVVLFLSALHYLQRMVHHGDSPSAADQA